MSPTSIQSQESELNDHMLKKMYPHTIISAPESTFTLEHRRQTPEEKKLIYSVKFEPDESKNLAIGYSDGTIGIFKVNDLERSYLLQESSSIEEKLPIGCLRWRPKLTIKDRILVSAGIDGVINYWSILGGKLLASIKPDKKYSDLLCLDYTRDATRLAAAGRRRSIKIFDDEKRSLISKLRHKGQPVIPGHSNRICALKFEENGRYLVSGSWDMTVKVWDVNTGTVVHSIYGPEISGDAIDVYGDYILTGSHRTKEALQIWSISMGKLVDTIEWDPAKPTEGSQVFSAQFDKPSLSQFIVACGSAKNEARIFEKRLDKGSGSPPHMFAFSCGVTDLPASCSSIDISSKENFIAIGTCDGICRLFERIEKTKRPSLGYEEGDF